MMNIMEILTLLKPVGAVIVTDTALWVNWALENDNKFSSYEIKILGKRIILYGGATMSMVAFGVPQEIAIAAAGLGPMAEFLMKQSHTAPVAPVQ